MVDRKLNGDDKVFNDSHSTSSHSTHTSASSKKNAHTS